MYRFDIVMLNIKYKYLVKLLINCDGTWLIVTRHPFIPTPAAIQALKRKKRYEKNLGQIDGTLSTIELQREALENASTNTEVLKAMHTASKSLKAAHNDL